MDQFKHITDWKLLRRSHEFPGPDGGTCINEAAIVACGMEYKKIDYLNDLPPCFSKVVGGFAMFLNDMFSDEQRELLMPFVTQLSGTASDDRVEYTRFTFLVERAKIVLCSLPPPSLLKLVSDRFVVLDSRFPSENALYSFRDAMRSLWYGYPYKDLAAHSLVKMLQEAILMGNHSSEKDISLVNKRLEAIKAKARIKEEV